MVKRVIIEQVLLHLAVSKLRDDEFFGWIIIGCDLQIPSILSSFLFANVLIKLV